VIYMCEYIIVYTYMKIRDLHQHDVHEDDS
jgi:hypothetical protein